MRIVFFGSPEFAVPSLAAVASDHEVVAVVTRPDRAAGRGMKQAAPPVKDLAAHLGLPVLAPRTLRAPELAQDLAARRPELFVVVAYGRILPPELLAIPPLGPWNVHASLLPRYRGAAPIQWAIIRGESETGVCIMRMEAGLDTGPVAARLETPIADTDTAASLSLRLSELGAALLRATLPRIAARAVTLEAQDETRATLAPPLRKEDGRLPFVAPARQLAAHARGVDPWPGPTAFLDGEVIKLFSPRLVDGRGEPGTVLGLVSEGLVVACGEGAVAFAELQLPGRRRLAAAAVVAGRPMPPGTRLRSDIVDGK
jgi:methionyl-tRNA formyltransferase